jgi:ABC-type glycerol-3-phosphate transport system substrate-binding protein
MGISDKGRCVMVLRRKILLGVGLILVIALLVISCKEAAPAEEEKIGTVEVLGVWGGDELASFEAMVAPWEQETGGNMEFTGTRDLIAILTTRVTAGNPPDVAILPNPGQMIELVSDGELVALDSFLNMPRVGLTWALWMASSMASS